MLIKCKECGGQVSTEAKSCPHCGCKVSKQIKAKNGTANKTSQKAKNILRYIFTFEWVDDVGDFLGDIPIVGGLLTVLFCLLCFGGIIAVAILLLCVIFEYVPRLGFALFAIGMGVISWFASYRWGARKKWFFWVGLVCSIAMLIGAFFADFS